MFSDTACGRRSVVKQRSQCTHCPQEIKKECLCDFLWCSLGPVCFSLHRFSCRAGTQAFSGSTHLPKTIQRDGASRNTTTRGPSFARSAQPPAQEVLHLSEQNMLLVDANGQTLYCSHMLICETLKAH